ncbi:ABC transporter permease [Lichenicoccus sp.]|uniref:ABC transporter permease n=1 Tax=Lichenicoccus sp. TaxID=2781899 RepID=UPI003D09A319
MPARGWRMRRIDPASLAPFAALAFLVIIGTLLNGRFLAPDNLANVVTRASFIAVIGIGATFVIAAGGLDLSVGSMSAFIGGSAILLANASASHGYGTALAVGAAVAIGGGALCGLANGLVITVGRLEAFIVTLGSMGIFRALTTYLAQGGSLSLTPDDLQDLVRPVYFGTALGIPVPVLVFLALGALAWVVLHRTPFGRHVVAIGANEEVARYSSVAIGRVRTITYVIQGACVGIATILYVPRLSSVTPTSGLLWELQAITAVVIGGTSLRGGNGRIWGTIAGALVLESVANIMVLSNIVSEYLIGAVQGAIIIVAMLVQRGLRRN